MLTPVLVCAMTLCPAQANAAQEPCHQVAVDDVLMLAVDCMGVDLFQQDVSDYAPPDGAVDLVVYAWADFIGGDPFLVHSSLDIRGPPDGVARIKFQSSLIFTTQRFRI